MSGTSGEPPDPHGSYADPDAAAPDQVSEAGDPVCWLALVCFACGALTERPHGPVCERCGSPRDGGQVG